MASRRPAQVHFLEKRVSLSQLFGPGASREIVRGKVHTGPDESRDLRIEGELNQRLLRADNSCRRKKENKTS